MCGHAGRSCVAVEAILAPCVALQAIPVWPCSTFFPRVWPCKPFLPLVHAAHAGHSSRVPPNSPILPTHIPPSLAKGPGAYQDVWGPREHPREHLREHPRDHPRKHPREHRREQHPRGRPQRAPQRTPQRTTQRTPKLFDLTWGETYKSVAQGSAMATVEINEF